MDWSKRILRWVLWAAALAVAVWVLWRLQALACVLLISAMLAYLLHKPLHSLQHRLSRGWALGILFGLMVGFLALFFGYAVPVFVRQAAELLGSVPSVMESLQRFVSQMALRGGEPFGNMVDQSFAKIFARITDSLGNATLSIATNGSGSIGWALLVPFLTFYMLKDHEFFLDQINYLVPVRWRGDISKLMASIDVSLVHFLRGQFLVSLADAVMMTVGLAILGVPNFLLLGLLCGITNMIPYVGPFLGALPVALSAAVVGWQTLVISLALIVVVQQIDNMVISPKILGDNLQIHPMYIILAILVGSGLLGFVGIVFSVPMLIIAREVGQYWFRRKLYQRRPEDQI